LEIVENLVIESPHNKNTFLVSCNASLTLRINEDH